jgi:copper transport outer membrane protein MctB
VISFRYHIVSIVAVFLALAIGLLAGSAFVGPGLVQQLRTQTNNLRSEVREREDELSTIRDEVAGLGAFVDSALAYLTENRLLGTDVIVVTQTGVEDDVVAQARSALESAGARIVTTVSATEQLGSDDPATQEQLAIMLGSPTAPATDLPSLAAEALAERLSPSAVVIGGDLLEELLSAGFLAPVGAGPSQAALEEIGSDGQVIVVLSGGRGDDPALAPESFAVPLVERLAELEVPVAAGESLLSDHPYVSVLRSDGGDGTVTVDDLDRTMGGAALVLGLEELLATGSGGAYGVKDGADPLPPAP